jgi:hypothetical protein
MSENHLNKIAKKIRNKLIYFIHLELKKKSKSKYHLLINSMSPKELNNKYQKCSDYCVERTETYSSSEINNVDNNNYFHISVTYCSLNNNYHMLIDNSNIAQVIGENNIIGKYYKGNTVNIRTTLNRKNNNYNIMNNDNDNDLEKIMIGKKILKARKKITCSSLNIIKDMQLTNENENNDIDIINNLNSNHNNYKKLINLNANNDLKKIETNRTNKLRKNEFPKKVSIYTSKLKQYCSTLKIIKKREVNNINQIKKQKIPELTSFPDIIGKKKNNKKERIYTMKSQKVKPKLHFPLFRNKDKDNHNVRYKTESQNTSINKNQNNKIRSQTKIYRNQFLFKIQEKKGINVKSRPQSIDMSNEENTSPKKNSPLKKIASPKKKGISPIKKLTSPRKLINSVQGLNDGQINAFQKSSKKVKNSEGSIINKFVSNGIIHKKKMFNINNNNAKDNNKNPQNAIKMFKPNETSSRKNVNKRIRRSNTLHVKYDY